MSTNNRISVLAPAQFPAFIQDDYPKFVRFLQAYYEFLEQDGNLNEVGRSLEDSIDLDNTLPVFLDHVKSKYAFLWPEDSQVDKALLIKNIRQFYQTKGTEASLKFLFRALFNEEIEVYYPNRNILRVSDGKWSVVRAFRVTGNIINTFIGDGTTLDFGLSDAPISKSYISIKINGATYPANNYSLANSTLSFNPGNAPGNGDSVAVSIDGADFNKFVNKTVYGSLTTASALVTSFSVVYDKGISYNEMKIADLQKDFEIGEEAYAYFPDPLNPLNPEIRVSIYITSAVTRVDVYEGGSGYLQDDPVLFVGGGGTGAKANVDETLKGGLSSVILNAAGAGYLPNSNSSFFTVTGGTGATRQATILLTGVDTSGNVHPSLYAVPADIIANVANLTIAGSWAYDANSTNGRIGFAGNTGATQNSTIENAMTYINYGPCGPILGDKISIRDPGEGYTTGPDITLPTPIMTVNTSSFPITVFGIMGSMVIVNQGSGYAVGDELIFTNPTPLSLGRDCAATVTSVTSNGGISKISFQAQRIAGTVNVYTTNANVIGSGTNFTGEVRVGDPIIVNNELKLVTAVNTATLLQCNSVFSANASGKKLGNYSRGFVGGCGYTMETLPIITISSANGMGANISSVAIIGAGEEVVAGALQKIGAIKSIKIISSGRDYTSAPTVDLTQSGDGMANAAAIISGGLYNYPGVFLNEDGMPSSVSRLQDRDFYQFFSYVIKSSKTLDAYEKTLKDIIHPLGMKYFAEFSPPLIELSANVTTYAANTGTANSIYIEQY